MTAQVSNTEQGVTIDELDAAIRAHQRRAARGRCTRDVDSMPLDELDAVLWELSGMSTADLLDHVYAQGRCPTPLEAVLASRLHEACTDAMEGRAPRGQGVIARARRLCAISRMQRKQLVS
jgi:hypothetical protein